LIVRHSQKSQVNPVTEWIATRRTLHSDSSYSVPLLRKYLSVSIAASFENLPSQFNEQVVEKWAEINVLGQ